MYLHEIIRWNSDRFNYSKNIGAFFNACPQVITTVGFQVIFANCDKLDIL